MENDKSKYHWSSRQKLSFPVNKGGIGFKIMKDVCQSIETNSGGYLELRIHYVSTFLEINIIEDQTQYPRNGILESHKLGRKWCSTKWRLRNIFIGDFTLVIAASGGKISWAQVHLPVIKLKVADQATLQLLISRKMVIGTYKNWTALPRLRRFMISWKSPYITCHNPSINLYGHPQCQENSHVPLLGKW